jgi:hypothetical protein
MLSTTPTHFKFDQTAVDKRAHHLDCSILITLKTFSLSLMRRFISYITLQVFILLLSLLLASSPSGPLSVSYKTLSTIQGYGIIVCANRSLSQIFMRSTATFCLWSSFVKRPPNHKQK